MLQYCSMLQHCNMQGNGIQWEKWGGEARKLGKGGKGVEGEGESKERELKRGSYRGWRKSSATMVCSGVKRRRWFWCRNEDAGKGIYRRKKKPPLTGEFILNSQMEAHDLMVEFDGGRRMNFTEILDFKILSSFFFFFFFNK
jgi:hypothetical protein